MGLDIRVFGETRVLVDGQEQDLGGRRPAEVLALLVAADGDAVDADVLAEQLWRGRPPASARTTLQGYVAGLRRVLDPGRPAREATILVTRGTGYALAASSDSVDLWRFAAHVRAGDGARARQDAAGATTAYSAALAAWRGDPLRDVSDVTEAQPAIAGAEEQHLATVERLAELRLEQGNVSDLVPALLTTAHEHPLRERLQTLLAKALYATGRQVDALEVLRRTRDRLSEELGLDASAQLRDLEAAILRQDPALSRTAQLTGMAGSGPAGAHQPPATTPTARPVPGDAPTAAVVVGRTAELDALRGALDLARSGRGTAAVVSGEPGIGKTALVEELLREPDLPVRWGRCPGTSGVPPYWLWQQVIGGLPTASGTDAGARFAVGIDIARRLQSLSRDSGLVVVVDDLQWADDDSVHVLEVVLSQLAQTAVLLVATVRDEGLTDSRIAPLLAQMARLPGSVRLPLAGLEPAEVAAIVARLTGRAPAEDELERLTTRSGGNPFFVSELASFGQGDGAVPAGVRSVLQARIATLTPEAEAVAAVVAVAGRDLALGLVAEALDRRVDDLSAAVAEATAHGVLSERRSGRLAVAHDLLREVLLERLGPARRAAVHAALAEALSTGAASATSAVAIAVHRSEAAAGAVDALAARACLDAAEQALAQAADAEARDLAARGLEHAPAGSPDLVGDLRRVHGIALRRLGHLEAGDVELAAAAALARSAGDDLRLARVALGSATDGASGYWGAMSTLQGTTELLEEAVAHAGNIPGPLRSSLLSALSARRSAVGIEASALAAEALELAAADPHATARALVADFVSRWSPATAHERLAVARRLMEAARAAPVYEATALHLLRCTLVETLQPEESAAVSARFSETVERRGEGDQLLLDLWWRSGLALARGDFDEARRTAEEAVRSAPTVSPAAEALTRMSRQTVEGIIAWHQHRLFDEIPDVVDLATVDEDWLSVLAQAHAQAGRREQAFAAVERLHAHQADGTRHVVRTILLADVYLELDDAAGAAAILPTLESFGDTMVVLWPGLTVLGPVSLYRGGLLALLGRPEADGQLTSAIAASEAFGFAPFADRARRLRDRLRRESRTAPAQTS